MTRYHTSPQDTSQLDSFFTNCSCIQNLFYHLYTCKLLPSLLILFLLSLQKKERLTLTVESLVSQHHTSHTPHGTHDGEAEDGVVRVHDHGGLGSLPPLSDAIVTLEQALVVGYAVFAEDEAVKTMRLVLRDLSCEDSGIELIVPWCLGFGSLKDVASLVAAVTP